MITRAKQNTLVRRPSDPSSTWSATTSDPPNLHLSPISKQNVHAPSNWFSFLYDCKSCNLCAYLIHCKCSSAKSLLQLLLVLEVLFWLLAQAAGSCLCSDISLILREHLEADVELLDPVSTSGIDQQRKPRAVMRTGHTLQNEAEADRS